MPHWRKIQRNTGHCNPTDCHKMDIIVELPGSLQRGMVTFASITSDWLEANAAMTQAKTRGGKVRYTIGDGRVSVSLAHAISM